MCSTNEHLWSDYEKSLNYIAVNGGNGCPFMGWKHTHTHTISFSQLITLEWALSNELTKTNSTLLCAVLDAQRIFHITFTLMCHVFCWRLTKLLVEKEKATNAETIENVTLSLCLRTVFISEEKTMKMKCVLIFLRWNRVEPVSSLLFTFLAPHSHTLAHTHIYTLQFNGTRWIFYFIFLTLSLPCIRIHSCTRTLVLTCFVFDIVWQI